ncbi:hypothetical protein NA57DRAFT_40917 [Rhizodiscina lignyota]|uniref:BTB domain-containing protein n=1 Tax=Rhizodiscina lignyota TaxID=1504668 RepID=A0A9P4IES3_9PEZI|nr:hypothetical protein NA57DRAFT_40917 [Rhizodiscina lignyota]
MAAVFKKHDIEATLYAEKQDIASGRLKDDNPLDHSEGFRLLCEACRRGDLKICQEQISTGVNINARDRFDYTPLILASLCGHYEVVRLLLESGALCERDTFQGERCLYNALNDRIRNLLLQYDYSKSTDPLQPLAGHITSLLAREHPNTSDISVVTDGREFRLHKFILSARSPFFENKLSVAPETTMWRLPNSIPSDSFLVAIKYLYLSEMATDLGAHSDDEEQATLTGIDKLSRQLEIERLFEYILERGDRRLTRQRRQDEVSRGRDQLEGWFKDNVIRHKVTVDKEKANEVRWDRSNGIFADVLLRADEEEDECEEDGVIDQSKLTVTKTEGPLNGLPIGNFDSRSRSVSRTRRKRKSVLYPCHRAMLTRSEFFMTMFSSSFREAQQTPYLQIIPIDCSPAVLEVILTYLYTERADFDLSVAIDVLFAADLLLLEKLKARAALIISTLGNGAASIVEAADPRGETAEEEVIDIYEVVRAGWDTRMHRLEEFGARYIAYRLERFVDEEEFAQLVRESAARIKERQETDTVELVDDIRYYLSERFRLRMEDAGLEEMMDDQDIDALASTQTKPDLDPTFADVIPTANFDQDEGYAADLETVAVVRTLDGEEVEDEFSQDAMNYQILLGKIDGLLDRLKLDA